VVSSEKRTRGPNKQTPWSRLRDAGDEGVSVLRLALDTSDPRQRSRIEAMYGDAYVIKRALQRAARDKSRAYWAAPHERAKDASAVRTRLGLSKEAFEYAAYAHLDAAPHLRRFVTKALAMHLGDAVWSGTERHLFCDASGKRHGTPRVGRWYDFTRIPGRARSHTKDRKWETFRIHGTLEGHRAAYTDRDGDFVQPQRMRSVESDRWWDYDGPLALVFSGLAGGTLVLPVRLPTAPCNQPILEHHLADPSRWHKIDLVRRRDPQAIGGWRYEAHLMVLVQPYTSPSTTERRSRTPLAAADRAAGIDVNVSKISIASHEGGAALHLTRVERDNVQKQRDHERAREWRRRQRALDRSRRAANRTQYRLSKRQEKRARRRAAAGIPPVEVIPMGPRKARVDGVPLQSYQRDQLSASYQRMRATQSHCAQAAARLRRDEARQTAAGVVATHGYQLVVEDCNIVTWARSWGRTLAACSPATLINAIDREARAVARVVGGSGGVTRVFDANDGALAALPVRSTSCQAPCRSRSPVSCVSTAGRSRRCRRHTRIVRRYNVCTRRLHPVCNRACEHPTHPSFFVSGVARHPVRVNRPLRSRRILRRRVDVYTRPCRGGSANVGTASCSTRNEPGHQPDQV
jgi:hypothetical protein